MGIRDIDINDFDYALPEDRIAQYPAGERDKSQLLIYKNGEISKDIFKNINEWLPPSSLLVFNNTRVIRARILFAKETGAEIEVLCLEPVSPADYTLSFGSMEPVEWRCIVGNMKKWKGGILKAPFIYFGKEYLLSAERILVEGEICRIRFSWNCSGFNFGRVIETAGHVPLPPYINREDKTEDTNRYQTIYSRIPGSVAAPTAGLHFTNEVFGKLKEKSIISAEITLHVGAGTFQPVKTKNISDHQMHREHFFITAKNINKLIENQGMIIPVGTTSVRTIESLYWLGVKLIQKPFGTNATLSLAQWEAYETETTVSPKESLEALLNFMNEKKLSYFQTSTSMIIVPGYKFRMTSGLITNFHQPRSSLLLLVSAWTGNNWKEIYNFALNNKFRFLSYGDSSLLL